MVAHRLGQAPKSRFISSMLFVLLVSNILIAVDYGWNKEVKEKQTEIVSLHSTNTAFFRLHLDIAAPSLAKMTSKLCVCVALLVLGIALLLPQYDAATLGNLREERRLSLRSNDDSSSPSDSSADGSSEDSSDSEDNSSPAMPAQLPATAGAANDPQDIVVTGAPDIIITGRNVGGRIPGFEVGSPARGPANGEETRRGKEYDGKSDIERNPSFQRMQTDPPHSDWEKDGPGAGRR